MIYTAAGYNPNSVQQGYVPQHRSVEPIAESSSQYGNNRGNYGRNSQGFNYQGRMGDSSTHQEFDNRPSIAPN